MKMIFQYVLTRKKKQKQYAHEVGVKTRCNIEEILQKYSFNIFLLVKKEEYAHEVGVETRCNIEKIL